MKNKEVVGEKSKICSSEEKIKEDKRLRMDRIIRQTGLSLNEVAVILQIPFRSLENWTRGYRSCPDYILDLIEYRLRNEGYLKRSPSQENKEGE